MSPFLSRGYDNSDFLARLWDNLIEIHFKLLVLCLAYGNDSGCFDFDPLLPHYMYQYLNGWYICEVVKANCRNERVKRDLFL